MPLRLSAPCPCSQEDTWRDLLNLGYSKSLDLLGTAPPPSPTKPVMEGMDELRSALALLKTEPENPSVHRRVAAALKATGRDEAAAKSVAKAEALEKIQAETVQASNVEDLD